MKYFLFISIIFGLISCATLYKDLKPIPVDRNCVLKFQPPFQVEWYKASVDIVGKHLSGLLLIKKMTDTSTRIVFTNESGITFFDFEFSGEDNFKVHQVIKKLNRKPVINTLRKDFQMILMQRASDAGLKAFSFNNEIYYALKGKSESDYFITDKDCASLLRIEKTSTHKKKVEVSFGKRVSTVPDSIHIQHFNFNMNISLKKLLR